MLSMGGETPTTGGGGGGAMLASPMAEYLKTSKSFYLEQITNLFNEQMYTSVLSFGSIALSLAERQEGFLTKGAMFKVLVMCGDSAYRIHEFPRAECYYRRALQIHKMVTKESNQKELTSEDSNDVKFKVHLCLMECQKSKEALNMLQSIPAKSRTVRVNFALGKLYMQNGLERAAITSFKEVLRECPTSLETIEALINLGLKESDLQSFLSQKLSKMPNPEWLYTWIKAQQLLCNRDLPNAIRVLNSITEIPGLQTNPFMLQQVGIAHVLNGDYEDAVAPLEMRFHFDASNLNGIDLLGFLYWSQKKPAEIEVLTHRLMDTHWNDNRSETWVVLAYYAQLTGRCQKGLTFAQKALTCTGSSVTRRFEALICKGALLLNSKKPHDAVECFRDAIQIWGNRFEAHEGLITCYMEQRRCRDASTIATFAMKKLGQIPRVLLMCALPLSKDVLNFPKAKAYLEKALQLNNRFLPAMIALTEILEEEGLCETAVGKLQELLANGVCNAQMHVRIAQLLSKMNQEDKAADHYAVALGLDPSCQEAKEGLNKLDPQGRHHDPTQQTLDVDVDHLDVDEEDEDDMDGDPVDWRNIPMLNDSL